MPQYVCKALHSVSNVVNVKRMSNAGQKLKNRVVSSTRRQQGDLAQPA
jgi:hypothetical protein